MKAFLLVAVAAIGSPQSGPYTVAAEIPVASMAQCETMADNLNPVYTVGVGVSRVKAWCELESETEPGPIVNRPAKSNPAGFSCSGCGESFIKPESRFNGPAIGPGVIW